MPLSTIFQLYRGGKFLLARMLILINVIEYIAASGIMLWELPR